MRFAGEQAPAWRLVVRRVGVEQEALDAQRLAPVVARAGTAGGGGDAVVSQRDRAPRRAGEGRAAGPHRIGVLGPGPRASRGEARRRVEQPPPCCGRRIPAPVGLGLALGGEERVGVAAVADEEQAVGGHRLGVQAERAEVLAQGEQHAPLVRARRALVEGGGERGGSARPGDGVNQVRLGLAFDVDLEGDRHRGGAGRGVFVEHGAEGGGRGEQAILVERRPGALVEGDDAQPGVATLGRALVERDRLGEAARVEAQVAQAQVGLLAERRGGEGAHQLVEHRFGRGVGAFDEDRAGVEQHGVAVRELRVLGQDRAVEREGRRVIEHGQRARRGTGAARADVVGHGATELLPRGGELDVGQAEAHLAAGERGGVALEERRQPRLGERPRGGGGGALDASPASCAESAAASATLRP